MHFTHPTCKDELVEAVLARKHHIEFSVHGLSHWQRVERNALFLAQSGEADRAVVSLFALFHDSQRLNDFEDPDHGARGAGLANEFFAEGLLPISTDQLNLLTYACTHHTDVVHHDDHTVQCCWDGDRLDLTRIGVLPDPLLLNTPEAKRIAETMNFSEVESSITSNGEQVGAGNPLPAQ